MEGEKVTFFVLKNNYLVTIISLTYCKRFRLEMLYCGTKMNNQCFRKQHSIADHLVALKIGRQTHYGLAGDT
jgi:hypothetical protein